MSPNGTVQDQRNPIISKRNPIKTYHSLLHTLGLKVCQNMLLTEMADLACGIEQLFFDELSKSTGA